MQLNCRNRAAAVKISSTEIDSDVIMVFCLINVAGNVDSSSISLGCNNRFQKNCSLVLFKRMQDVRKNK